MDSGKTGKKEIGVNESQSFALKGKRKEAVAGGRRGGGQRNAATSEVLAFIKGSSPQRDKGNSSEAPVGREDV